MSEGESRREMEKWKERRDGEMEGGEEKDGEMGGEERYVEMGEEMGEMGEEEVRQDN